MLAMIVSFVFTHMLNELINETHMHNTCGIWRLIAVLNTNRHLCTNSNPQTGALSSEMNHFLVIMLPMMQQYVKCAATQMLSHCSWPTSSQQSQFTASTGDSLLHLQLFMHLSILTLICSFFSFSLQLLSIYLSFKYLKHYGKHQNMEIKDQMPVLKEYLVL